MECVKLGYSQIQKSKPGASIDLNETLPTEAVPSRFYSPAARTGRTMGRVVRVPPMPNRLSAYIQSCLDKAAECDRKALEARDPDTARFFELLAARWRLTAANRDFSNRVEDILRSLRGGPFHSGFG